MKTRIYFLIFITLLIILYVGGCRRAGTWLIKVNQNVHVDAIVLLMGSITDRVLQASDLYQSGAGDRLIIVEGSNDGYGELTARGADMISGTHQVSKAAISLGIPKDSITILSGGAQSTSEEALIIRSYLRSKPEIDSLILVTLSPHARRAAIIFIKVFKGAEKKVFIGCGPNQYTNFNPNKWWKSKDDIETVLLEYIKLMHFVLFESRKLEKKICS